MPPWHKDQYGLTDLATYQHQARHAINMQRMTAAPSVKQWPYRTDGHPPTRDHSSSPGPAPTSGPARGDLKNSIGDGLGDGLRDDRGALGQGGDRDLRDAIGRGGSVEPEARVIEAREGFVRAEGSRGWRGVD